uniref:TSG101 and ALIX binding domain-containing protein n=1 Tax=Eptatretus burgeri TaxID=7764 RepID=A0A8C4R2N9_EPTBU
MDLLDQLKDALEKNRHWMLYNQQRELFISDLQRHVSQLEETVREMATNITRGTERRSFEEFPQSKTDRDVLGARTTKLEIQVEKLQTQVDQERQEKAHLQILCSKDDLEVEIVAQRREVSMLQEQLAENEEHLKETNQINRQMPKKELKKIEDQLAKERKELKKTKTDLLNLLQQLEDEKRSAAHLRELQIQTGAALAKAENAREELLRKFVELQTRYEKQNHFIDNLNKDFKSERELATKAEAERELEYRKVLEATAMAKSEKDRADYLERQLRKEQKVREAQASTGNCKNGLTLPNQERKNRHMMSTMGCGRPHLDQEKEILECPRCHIIYPLSHSQDLVDHLDVCS